MTAENNGKKVALWMMVVAFVALTVSSGYADTFVIDNCKVCPDGTVALSWVGATKDITVEYSTDMKNWIPLPTTKNQWPIKASFWVGTLSNPGTKGFFRVSAGDELFTPAVPFKIITLDMIGIHDSASDNYNSDCLACHSERLKEVSLDHTIPAFHAVHTGVRVPYFGRDNERCLKCHVPGPDFLTYSAGGLRRQVDHIAVGCTFCHGPQSSQPFYEATGQ